MERKEVLSHHFHERRERCVEIFQVMTLILLRVRIRLLMVLLRGKIEYISVFECIMKIDMKVLDS